MEIKFVGRETIDKCYDFGVRGDNNAEIVEFVVGEQQGDLDLSGFKAYVKSATPMYNFLDKEELEVEQGDKEGELKLVWHLLAKHTDNELLNVQLQFEDEANEVIWQTKVINFHFDRSVRADQEVRNTYPHILQEQDRRIKQLEQRDEQLEQQIIGVVAEIPTTAGDINAVPTTRKVNGKALSEDITITAEDTGALSNATKYGASIVFTVNSADYTLSVALKDQDGHILGDTQVVDLPLESVVVSGEYDSANQVLVLTLQNGGTIEIPVSSLLDGLQPEINAQHKLNADYIEDGATNKVYTETEKTKLSGVESGAEVNKIESISLNGVPLSIDDKNVDIPEREIEWGNIGGNLTDQRDLKEALSFKQDTLTFDNEPTLNSQNPITSGGAYNALEHKQNAIGNTNLTTVDKSIVGAINEVDSLAKGKVNSKTYSAIQTMVYSLNQMPANQLKVGDNLYIVANDVPDLWVCKVEQTPVDYVYTTDSDFISAIKDNVDSTVQVGYYRLCKLETEKVDLSDVVKHDSTITFSGNGNVITAMEIDENGNIIFTKNKTAVEISRTIAGVSLASDINADTLREALNVENGAEANAVDSVNGKTGVVVLDADDIEDTNTSNKFVSESEKQAIADIPNKVDKVSGKGLSENDFTTAYKNKLDGIEAGAEKNLVTSVAGKTGAVTLDADDISETNDKKFVSPTEKNIWGGKQDALSQTQLDAVNSGIDSTKVGKIATNETAIGAINEKIPSGASSSNKLVHEERLAEYALPIGTAYGASISLSIDTTNYVVTAQLKDQDGNNLGSAQTIDLPLESVVVDGYYDIANKKVILTLQNGSTIEFSVADLISGLQSEITAQNPLNADLVDDTSSTHKFATTAEKTKLAGISAGAQVNTIESISVNNVHITVDGNKNANITVPDSATWGNISGTLADQTDLKNALDSKQDTLQFDNNPTANSSNPVKSGGVYNALPCIEDYTVSSGGNQ